MQPDLFQGWFYFSVTGMKHSLFWHFSYFFSFGKETITKSDN